MSSWIKISVHLSVSLNYISCLRCLSRSLSLSLCPLLSVVHEHSMQYSKMPRVSCGSKDYGVLEVKCKREWFQSLFLLGEINTSFILKHNSVTAYCSFKHSTARIASLALGKIQKWLAGRVILEIAENRIFRKFCLKPPPCCILANWPDWTVPSKSEISTLKTFYVVIFLSMLSFYNLLSIGSARALIVLNIEWVQFVL